jgi:hypothetical protein
MPPTSVFLGGGGDTSLLHYASLIMSDAQIKALPSTPITFVSALGANKQIIPTLWIIRSQLTAAYTNVSLTLGDTTINVSIGGAVPFSYLRHQILQNTSPETIVAPPQTVAYTDELNDWATRPRILSGYDQVNTPLTVESFNVGGDFTGGHADNEILMSITYMVLDVSTGIFE